MPSSEPREIMLSRNVVTDAGSLRESGEQAHGRMLPSGRCTTKQRPGVVPGIRKTGRGSASERTEIIRTMKSEINRWGDVDWPEVRRYVTKLQRNVFDAALRDDIEAIHRYQRRLLGSFQAKLLAVRQVAQSSSGKKTAGIDGVESPTPVQRFRMAEQLDAGHRPSAVRRLLIPKPGKTEKRPLGIPNLIDRAHQALIALALEPEWEARFSPRQYGFRKGRGTHDAIGYLQRHFRKTGPEWVLDADIEKFFDHLDHDELLRRTSRLPLITLSLRRILKAGALSEVAFEPTMKGTPQGGPLSPLLANVALASLEPHLHQEFRKEFRGRVTKLGEPAISIYADDLVVAHSDHAVVEWSATAIGEYLAGLGLRLSLQKTKIVHTMDRTGNEAHAGFDFLGFHLQHHETTEFGGTKRPYLIVRPSKAAEKRFYRDIADYADRLKLSRKSRGARQHRMKSGRKDPISIMIVHLNRMISGWANYYRYSNATETFSRMDHKIHTKLRGWAKRRFSDKSAGWIKKRLFSGIELDHNGNPLKRKDGTPRNRDWAFTSPFVKNGPTLKRLADTGISKQILVQPGKSYYDSDWPYWQLRLRRSRYYATPLNIEAAAFRRQKGHCAYCEGPILLTDACRTLTPEGQRQSVVVHNHCSMSHSPPVTGVVDLSTAH